MARSYADVLSAIDRRDSDGQLADAMASSPPGAISDAHCSIACDILDAHEWRLGTRARTIISTSRPIALLISRRKLRLARYDDRISEQQSR
jgi:hypothetical protein